MNVPWATTGIAALAVAAHLVPGAGEAFALDRAAPGEPWRWLLGHVAHFSTNHLLWDLAVFGVLGAWLELHSRLRWAGVVVGSAIAISAAFWLAMPGLDVYRGLSGIDAALFAAVAVELWRTARTGGERRIAAALGAALAGKVLYEAVTGDTLFADVAGWVPVPVAHLVGGLVGATAWGLGGGRPQR